MAKKKSEIKQESKEETKTELLEVIQESAQEDEVIIEKPTETLAAEMGEVKEIEQVLVEEARQKGGFEKNSWNPKTSLGMKVKSGEITSLSQILDQRTRILEPEIVDALMPGMQTDLLMIGQSKGKFGGGQKRIFKQTQKKTQEGNKPHFATFAVIGNEDGFVGLGYGKSKETVPAREKAIRQAKLNVIKIRRGCGDWGCGCGDAHTVPFKVSGKVGSVTVTLIPAPKGTGLKAEKECAKVLKLAGIKDVWSRAEGQTRSKLNVLYACFIALKKLIDMKVNSKSSQALSIVEGSIKN